MDASFDLFVWQEPRDLDPERIDELLTAWQASGADPAQSPFAPSTDVGWFYRELLKDVPELDAVSDAVPSTSRLPIWLATEAESPARVVAIRLPVPPSIDLLDEIFGLAGKYDLVLFEPRNGRVHLPLEEMAAYASATFWPAGAIQAALALGVGAFIAAVAWLVGIPILSGVLIVVGGFMFLMAVYTFVHEGRKALRGRRSRGGS